MELNEIIAKDGLCECGKVHDSLIKKTVICDNALEKIPSLIKEEGSGCAAALEEINRDSISR